MKTVGSTSGPKRPLSAFEVYKQGKEPSQSEILGRRIAKKKKLERKLKKAVLLAAKASSSPGKVKKVKPSHAVKSKKEKDSLSKKTDHKIFVNGDVTNETSYVRKESKKNNKNKSPHRHVSNEKVSNGLDNKKKVSKQKGPAEKTKMKSNKTNDLKEKIKKVKMLVDEETKGKKRNAHHVEEEIPELALDSDEYEEGLESDEEAVIESDDEVALESDEFDDDDDEEEEEEEEEEEGMVSLTAFMGEEIDAVNCEDSRKKGQETFKWIIHPHNEENFFSKFFEKKPLLIKRKDRVYYKGLFSTEDFDKILHEQVVLYSKNLDVTSYTDGKRETHNPIGQAHAPVVWDYYNNGCSLRLLNPQTFHPRVWKCLASLQEYFNSFCGANVYLTPPDTQGFAPHWDDIEAFILQLEGKKRWRVYAPRNDEEVLPVYSSPNLSDETIGKPILDTILEPGDLLYFPRGFIHQGHAAEKEHSLHITISTYQKNTWGHYLEKLLPQALSVAMSEDVKFRQGLPRRYPDYMGVIHMEKESEDRTAFKKKVCDLVMRMLENAPYDAAIDQRGSSFMHDCLPPYLTEDDKKCSVYGGGEKWCKRKKKVINRAELQPDTFVRLIRGNCIRLVAAAENIHVYHCLENSREYHKEEPQYLEVAVEHAPGIEALIMSYPAYLTIESLPLEDDGEKMTLASGLWERGLLVTSQPLEATYDD